jgi:SAM-dependent methyltransferase
MPAAKHVLKATMSLSEKYDRFYGQVDGTRSFADVIVRGWPRDRVQAIIAHAGSGGAVLDVGCGDGHLLYQLRSRFTRLVGLEYSAGRLAEARRNLHTLPFEGHLGSAESMKGIADGSIDCVVSADTIEHVPDVYAAAGEIFRVLKPGGRLVINTPNIAFIKKRALLLLGKFPSTSQPNEGLGSDVLFDGGHLHYFTFRSLRLLLLRAGFRTQGQIGYGKFGFVHHLHPPLLSGGVQLIAVRP